MKRICTFALFLYLTACGNAPTTTPSDSETNSTSTVQVTSSDLADSTTTGRIPDHNYAVNENGIYLYAQTLSQADLEAGIAAAGFVALKYLGVKDGLHYLQYENSMVIATCENPCTVIRQTLNGQVMNRIQYNPQTIIGAAFEDAINGHLKSYGKNKVNSEKSNILKNENSEYVENTKTYTNTDNFESTINEYYKMNSACISGKTNDAQTEHSCEVRDKLHLKIEKLGYCYGESAEFTWSKCMTSR